VSSNLRATPGAFLQSDGGLHGKAKASHELLDIEKRLNQRMKNISTAFLGQTAMHDAAKAAGQQSGGGWYAVLPEGEEEYDYEKVLWINVAKDSTDTQAAHAAVTMLGTFFLL
jgi:hypothetical protein